MEQTIYRLILVLTGLANIGMSVILLRHTHRYTRYANYRLTRFLTAVWLVAFGIGYMIHAAFQLRYFWPSAASALSATYFHIGAVCFSWGYTPLLNPDYLTKRIVIRDSAILAVGIVSYWTVALLSNHAPFYTFLSFSIFFIYAVFGTIVFYSTYNRVSYRMIKMAIGSVGNFVKWMQVCCDLIILFGISSVAITAIFPTEIWPYTILLLGGVGMFGYIAYSLEKYGAIIHEATKATLSVTAYEKEKKKKKSSTMRIGYLISTIILALWATMFFTACEKPVHVSNYVDETDSLINVAYKMHDYERILELTDEHNSNGRLSDQKTCYWRGYAYSRMHKVRLAEMEWKQALALGFQNEEEMVYYSKSANRLAGLLYMKFDYEGTIQVTANALTLLKEHDYTMNTDYANLLTFIGNCQLKLGHLQEASSSYSQAYRIYQKTTDSNEDISNYTSSIVGIISITDCYIQTNRFQEAYEWTERFDSLLERYRQHPQADASFMDKEWARLNFYRGFALEGLSRKDEAEKAYQTAIKTQYAKTADGQIEATNYLIAARRWREAADKYTVLEAQLTRYDAKMTLDNIQTYLVPKYLANVGAQRTDSAIAVGKWICESLDSAIVWERLNAAVELATIYDTQQKETEIVEQQAAISHQRFLSTVFSLVLVIFGFCLFIYFRHKAALRLEKAYHDLEVANARAEDSSRMKSNFIQQISHEIRTPLNILSGFTQVITSPGMELDETTRKEIHQKIIENTDRITGLVNKMLELSDAKSMTVIERTDKVSAVQIAAEAAEVTGIADSEQLTFDLKVSPDTEQVMLTTNQEAAVRALSLILDNARKFSAPAESKQDMLPHGQKMVVLRVTAQSQQVVFAVEDNGIGVPPAEAEHIFEEFVQLDQFYDGTGIGLTVARSLARRLGGDILLDTAYTAGARFILTLPYDSDSK